MLKCRRNLYAALRTQGKIDNIDNQSSYTTLLRETLVETLCGYPLSNKSYAALDFLGATLPLRLKKNGRRVKKGKICTISTHIYKSKIKN